MDARCEEGATGDFSKLDEHKIVLAKVTKAALVAAIHLSLPGCTMGAFIAAGRATPGIRYLPVPPG